MTTEKDFGFEDKNVVVVVVVAIIMVVAANWDEWPEK